MKKYFSLFLVALLAASLSALSFAKSDDDEGEGRGADQLQRHPPQHFGLGMHL